MKCGFGAHKRCVNVLEHLQSDEYDSNNPFRCEVVAHQLYKTDVDELCGDIDEIRLSKIEKSTRINPKTYSFKRKRFINGSFTCKCGMTVDIDDEYHKLQECDLAPMTPVKPCDRFIYPRIKRLCTYNNIKFDPTTYIPP